MNMLTPDSAGFISTTNTPPFGSSFPPASTASSSYVTTSVEQDLDGHVCSNGLNAWSNNLCATSRRRSNAIVDGMQNAPKGKVSIAMGFRADCEKCKARVPGHWSHVVRV
jgi:hypothetical protein